MHIIQELFEEAGYVPESYSGRGMFGARCLGVVVPQGTEIPVTAQILKAAYERSAEAGEEAGRAFAHVRWDDMGLDRILYFPRIAYEAGDDLEIHSPS